MAIEIKYRSTEEEIMDDFDLQGKDLQEIFADLEKVNKWLGGTRITLDGIKKVLAHKPAQKLKIADIGCGNGAMLKEVADFGRRKGLEMELLGIDANSNAIEIARRNTRDYPEIDFEVQDIFSEEFADKEFDLILCTLTLHHFNDKKIQRLMETFVDISKLGIVINDLQRSRTAYYLFHGFGNLFMKNKIAKKDGLTSILRGFRRDDLESYGRTLDIREQHISWKWAYRYQWVLIK